MIIFQIFCIFQQNVLAKGERTFVFILFSMHVLFEPFNGRRKNISPVVYVGVFVSMVTKNVIAFQFIIKFNVILNYLVEYDITRIYETIVMLGIISEC